MSAGSGPMWREPFATYDPASCSWRTSQPSLFEDLPASPPTWPKSGTWDLGAAYEHPMSVPLTDASESSSSLGLPTPMAADGGLSRGRLGGGGAGGFGLRDFVRDLLPTPRPQTGGGGAAPDPPGRVRSKDNPDGHSPNLMTVVSLLKTPTAQLAVNGGSQHPDKRREGGHGPTLADQVEHQLLPTPAARDWKSGQSNLIGTNARPLNEVVEMLLPTPTAPGEPTSRPSTVGKPSSDGQPHVQLSLDEQENG